MLYYGLYARKSHDDRRITEKSIGEQVEECREIASNGNLRIVWVAEESKSAMKPRQRPHYSQMIKLIRKGSFNAIVCWHVNRLIRNMEEGGELIQLMIDGRLKEIRTPHAVYRSSESIWPVVIEAASATQFSIDQRRTVKRSSDGNFRSGGWNHKAPPGYKNVRDTLNPKRGQIIPDPDRFPLIREAWTLLLTGSATGADIWRELDIWGYRVRETLNLSERPLGYLAVMAIFRNPFYAGYVRRNGELIKGRHTAMVSLEEFDRAQQLLSRRTFKAARHHFHRYTGLLTCAYCGQKITAEWKTLTNGSRWETYHCSDSYEKCTQRGIAATEVEKQLSECLRGLRFDPEILDVAALQVRKALNNQQEAFRLRTTKQEEALASAEKQLTRLGEMWLTGLLDDPERYREMEARLLERKSAARLARDESNDQIGLAQDNLDRAVEYLKTGYRRFALARPEEKGEIVRALGSFKFFGREKKIEAGIRPVLREFTVLVKEIGNRLEPSEIGLQKQNRVVREGQLCLGRPRSNGLEPVPDALIVALREDVMPRLGSLDTDVDAGNSDQP